MRYFRNLFERLMTGLAAGAVNITRRVSGKDYIVVTCSRAETRLLGGMYGEPSPIVMDATVDGGRILWTGLVGQLIFLGSQDLKLLEVSPIRTAKRGSKRKKKSTRTTRKNSKGS
jgi:hypothetical protein